MYYQVSPYPVRQNDMKLTVIGEGTVSVQPDQATITLGVVTENANLRQAQERNAQIATRIRNSLLEQGIPRENIQTSEFRVDMNYDYKDGVQQFRGYRVTNLITVTISDLARIGELVDIAVDNGANTVRNINLTLANQDTYYNEALTRAIQNAQQKAVVVGQTLGVDLNQTPVQIQELTSRAPIEPRPMVLGISTEQATTTPIETGQLKITASVEAKFVY
ncbi:SIMPL domain-containing protein [Ornithinibacillus contaminans]|uniref:SIMPL domain-containing protein n=1 Tax=Ornithinibacillus contaminans TaxID=694055 RepID=UPI00064D82AC|nr:SIMPL domain-containing protein [Ornithinibacillus contaminans]